MKTFKHFDITTKHLNGSEFYRVPKARSQDEIDRRRQLPPGTVGAEYQRNGTFAAAHVVRTGIRNEEDHAYARRLLAPAGINTDWFGYTRWSDKMRNVRNLPFMVVDPDNPENNPDMLSDAGYELQDAGHLADALVVAIANHSPRVDTLRKNTSRRIGDASLKLACSQMGSLEGVTPFVGQVMARQECLGALALSRRLGEEIGVDPSFAQLADPNSLLARHIRDTAPAGIYDAFDEATEEWRMPV